MPGYHMHGVKDSFRSHPRTTGNHGKLLLAFESCPMMEAILSELGEAAAQFHPVPRVRFVLFYFVPQALLRYGERAIESVSKKVQRARATNLIQPVTYYFVRGTLLPSFERT
jgi:hypothetical protein